MHYIYKITNIVNNKVYIGQTNNPDLRWSQHKSNAKYERGTQVVTHAISKYGVDNFIFEIIASCKIQKDINDIEIKIIAQYESRNPDNGYNIDIGGYERSPDMGNKISASLLKYYETHDNWNKGGTLPEEWKQAISIASMGKPGTNTGKVFSDEWANNMSKNHAGKSHEKSRRFSLEIEQEICRLYAEEKYSRYKLGQAYNCHRSLIKSILDRNSIFIREDQYSRGAQKALAKTKRKYTLLQEEEVCRLYHSGMSRKKVAEKTKIPPTTIRAILIRYRELIPNSK